MQDWLDEEEAKAPGFIASLDEDNLRAALAADLRRLREAADLTQVQLGEKIGVTQPVIARLESGKVMPDVKTLHRIAQALGQMVVISFKAQPGRRRK